MQPKHADRIGWRRIARTDGAWELVLTLNNVTQGEMWDALQKETFMRVPADADINREYEFAVTLAGERPPTVLPPDERRRTTTYMDRMMRARP